MDLLIVEPLEAEVMAWLSARHSVQFAPELALEPRELRQALYNVRAMIVPACVTIDAQTLDFAPLLCAVGRMSDGAENMDLEACARARVEVVRGVVGTAQAEAEFMVGAVLSQLRHLPVPGEDGQLVSRELGAATVGLVGLSPAVRPMVHVQWLWHQAGWLRPRPACQRRCV
jgi:D-3-phosphoglycerate dehydrogenase / 2-oxoglutarate reductase